MTEDESRIQWLLVDIGDVLLLKDTGYNFSELLADELGVSLELAQAINKAHYTTMESKYISEADFIADLKQKLGYNAPKNIYSYFAKAYQKQVRPNNELFTVLEEIRATGIKTAILSNTIAIYRDIQAQLGISAAHGFEPVIYSWDVGLVKPETAIFELALEKLNTRPEQVLFIDDKPGHLAGAQQVGMRTLLFEDTKKTIAFLRHIKNT